MSAPDFWNLAGRAGRWGDEFQGNIVCIDHHQESVWPGGVPLRSRFPIARETDSVLTDEDALLEFLKSRAELSAEELRKRSHLEQVSAYLISTYIRDGTLLAAPFSKRHSRLKLERLDEAVAASCDEVCLPAELISRHPGVSALGLQMLLNYFRSSSSPGDLFPLQPESDQAYERFCEIMRTINKFVFPAFYPEGRIPLYSLIVSEWLKGYPLHLMISKRISYHQKHQHDVKIGAVIRDTMELVEQCARFLAPKYFSSYVDVLQFHCREIGFEFERLKGDLDIAVALEFGVSSRTLLSLMELGLSRMAAFGLYEAMANDDLSKASCAEWIKANRQLVETLDLPKIVLREISEKIQ